MIVARRTFFSFFVLTMLLSHAAFGATEERQPSPRAEFLTNSTRTDENSENSQFHFIRALYCASGVKSRFNESGDREYHIIWRDESETRDLLVELNDPIIFSKNDDTHKKSIDCNDRNDIKWRHGNDRCITDFISDYRKWPYIKSSKIVCTGPILEKFLEEISKLRSELEQKSPLSIYKKNPTDDVVIKVLNYTVGCDEELGCESSAWRQAGKRCTYELIGNTSRGLGPIVRSLRVFNFNDYDPRSIQISTETKRPFPGGTLTITENVVRHEGKELFRKADADQSRLARAWGLVYSKYCKGKVREF
jgi:hypothetical protein